MVMFKVVLTKLNGPFGEQVLEVAEYYERTIAETVSRAWAELPEVKAGDQRVKVVTR